MNESYKELLVKKDRGIKETLIRFLSLLPTVFLGFLTFVTGNMIFFIIVIALGVLSVEKVEIMAPEKSHQLDSYRNRQTKVTDLSAGHDLPDQKLYWIFYEGNQRILMNLTEDFARTIKGIAPRKVFTE